jgi:tetratricopeptide (TPR) repeat protein
MRKFLAVVMTLALALFLTVPAMAQPKAGTLMTDDAFTPIALGFDLMRDGKYDAAEMEFKKAIKADRYNPFALNNLAALEEKKGNLKDAMAYLTDAGEYADRYVNKVEQTCFVGGLCAGVKPLKKTGTESTIAPVVAENMKKLKDKMAATPAKPEPSKPPKMK